MVVAIFLSRILGLVRESAIAARFGQGALTDAYNAAFLLPDLLYFMVAGGALSSAFIPVFTEYLATDREDDAWDVYSSVLNLMALVVGVLVALAFVLAPLIVPFFAPRDFTGPQLEMTARLTRILLPAQFFFFMGGLTMGTLYARNRFLVPALGPIIYNLGIITGAVWLAGAMGIYALAWGALAGAFFGNFALQLWYSARLGIGYRLKVDLRHPGVRRVFLLMLPVLLGLSLPQVDVMVNKWFARFLEEGSMSALNYANRLMQVPLGVFGQAAGIAALPALSALAARRDWNEYRETLSFGLRSVFFATVPSSVLMMVLAVPTVRLFLQAGAFTERDTAYAAVALVYYSVGVFAWAGQAIVARGFYALQDTVTPVVIGTVMTFLFVPLNYALMRPLGHGGLALATSIMAIVHLVVMSAVLAKRVQGIGARRIVVSTLRILAASGAAALAAWAVSAWARHLETGSGTLGVKAAAAAELVPSFLAGMLVYLLFCRLLRVEEAAVFARMLARRLRRAGEGAIP